MYYPLPEKGCYHENNHILFLLVRGINQRFDMDNASAAFISHLKKSDSISEFLSQGTLFENRSKTAIDSLLRDILYNNPQLYGILRVCQDGKVLNDINRGTNSNATLNVKNRPWFQTSIEKGSSYTGDVFTVNSNVCF